MSEMRDYFDRANPTIVAPGEGRLGGPRQLDLYTAWNRLSRRLFVTMPTQLDRCRSFRNRFIQAVR